MRLLVISLYNLIQVHSYLYYIVSFCIFPFKFNLAYILGKVQKIVNVDVDL